MKQTHLIRVLLLVLFGTGGLGSSVSLADEQPLIAGLRRVGAYIQTHRDDGRVRLLRMSGSRVADEHLAAAGQFERLEYLAVMGPSVGDAGLEQIAELAELKWLVLNGAGVTDVGLRSIARLPALERLYLEETRLTDAGLKHLAGVSTLRVLSLAGTAVTDAGLVHVAGLTGLEVLDLRHTAVTDAGLSHLSRLTNLRELDLSGTRIDGSGWNRLTELAQLETADVSRTRLDDAAVADWKRPPRLKRLLALGTDLSNQGLATLRTALEGTDVRPRRLPDSASARPPHGEVASAVPESHETSAEVELRPVADGAPLRFAADRPPIDETPDFRRHVMPLLGRLGCNGRNCHGSFQGRGGFLLSMFGYDFDADHEALTGESPRVDRDSPDDSLILIMPTDAEIHGGGKRFEPGEWEYRLLRRWIEAGAPPRPADGPNLLQLDVTPREIVFSRPGESVRLKVTAVWSDGSREDVTPLSRFQTNDDAIAEIDADGRVRAVGRGNTCVVGFYDDGVVPVQVMLPVSDRTGDRYPDVSAPTEIDRLVVKQLRKLGIVPAELADDAEFLRRVSLDITGTLPPASEIEAFLSDTAADKRTRKIDELLERPAYVAWWTVKLCDLTGSNAALLGATDVARIAAEQWQAWMERRVRDNVGWDRIVEGIVLATSRRAGETYEEFVARQSAFSRQREPDDFTSLDNPLPHYWYRSNQATPEDRALTFGYTFLGVRLDCAQCHKHPFDQWSKDDFDRFTQFFRRVSTGISPESEPLHDRMREMLGVPTILNTAATRRGSYLQLAGEGRAIPWREVFIADPKPADSRHPAYLLGWGDVDLEKYDDPRRPLMDWLLDEQNPYFVRAIVNRVWAHYFSVGIVDPPDDLNLANPPSNPELLDHLCREFVAHGYDLKRLHRTIANSRTYQLSWVPNETNARDERNFSRQVVRRLPAEVVVDALVQATAGDEALRKFTADVGNRRIAHHPRSTQARTLEYSLLIFGKPLRTTTCDCERRMDPTLLQALYLRNDTELLDLLERGDGWLVELARRFGWSLSAHAGGLAVEAGREQPLDGPLIDQLVREAYLRTLSRPPANDEQAEGRRHLKQAANPVEGLRDLVWALLNTQEFITNH